LRIDADGGFVAEQELGFVQQRRHEIEPPLHAAGKRFHGILAPVGELHGLQGFVDALAQFGAAQAVEFAEDTQVLLCGELLVEREVLRDEAEFQPRGTITCGGGPLVESEFAGIGLTQSGDERHQRGLARAVGPQQAEAFPRVNLERNLIERGQRTISFGDGG
jgi:hypothetical protein